MNWREKANDILEKIKKYRDDTDGWKEAKKDNALKRFLHPSEKKEVTVWWKHSPDWDGALYRAEGIMEADPETVFRYVDPDPDSPRGRWDKAIKELQIIERIDKDLSVARTITHNAFKGLIASRDFTDLVINIENEEFLSTNAQGIEHPDCPATSEHVRGTNHPCAIICYRVPGNPNQTRVASYIQTDLGGMLPKQLVENALPSNMVNFFTSLKNILQEDGHWKGAVNGNTTNGDAH